MHAHMCAQLCPSLCNPMDCNPRGSSVHGILQARILEWVGISFSRFFTPRYQTHGSCGSCTGRQFLYHWASWEALKIMLLFKCVFVCFFNSLVKWSIFHLFLPFFTYESYTSILSPFLLLLPFVFLLYWNSFDIHDLTLRPFKSLILRACWDFPGGKESAC